MVESGRYRYASEKLYMVARYAMVGEGDARARLGATFTELMVLRAEHCPPAAWKLVEEVLAYLMKKEQSVDETVRRMRKATASRLLCKLWDAYQIVEDAYRSEMT